MPSEICTSLHKTVHGGLGKCMMMRRARVRISLATRCMPLVVNRTGKAVRGSYCHSREAAVSVRRGVA